MMKKTSGQVSRAAVNPVGARSLRSQLADVLEAAILLGEYEPGARLIERALIERFGVSSIPVREALQDLESRGLVVKLPNVGCRVVELSAEDARAVRDLRRHLEPRVTRWAAERFTEEWREPLTAQWRKMLEAAELHDVPAFFHEDLALHRMVWRIAGNRFAARALETAVGPLFASGLVQGTRSGRLEMVKEARKHEGIVNAVVSGDGDQAERLLLEMASEFEDYLQESGEPPARTSKNGSKGRQA
jgi:DNA-binding GntR family transcriptional regulator